MSDLKRYGYARPTDTRPSELDDGYWTPWHIAQAEVERASQAADDFSRQNVSLRAEVDGKQRAAEFIRIERDAARAEVARLTRISDHVQTLSDTVEARDLEVERLRAAPVVAWVVEIGEDKYLFHREGAARHALASFNQPGTVSPLVRLAGQQNESLSEGT
jgi:hypothetical protein